MKFRFFRAARLSALAAVLTTAIVGAPHLYAQTPSQSTPSVANIPRTITLDDAIKEAIARNYTVRTAGNAAKRSSIVVTQSKDNAWLPSAGASGSWGYSYSLEPLSTRTLSILRSTQGFVPTTSGDSLLVNGVAANTPVQKIITPAGSQSLKWDASASYNIFHGGSDVALINQSEAFSGASNNSFIWTRQVTAFNVTTDYLNVLRTNELVDAADSTLAEGLAQLRLVQGQYDAGVVPIGQVYQQKAVVGQDSLALIQAINNYQNAKTNILFLLNVPPNDYSNYNFNVVGIDTSTSPAVRAAVDTTITDAQLNDVIDKRPDILAQSQNIQASLFAIDITRGALLPSLDASAGISGAGTAQSLTGIQMNTGLNVGLSLSIPIFDQFQNELIIQEKEVDAENERITLEQDVQQLRSDAAQAINNLKASDLALNAGQSALTSADESFRLASERFRVGAGTEVDVIIAESALEVARANWVNAKYNWVLAQRQLAYTLGHWNY